MYDINRKKININIIILIKINLQNFFHDIIKSYCDYKLFMCAFDFSMVLTSVFVLRCLFDKRRRNVGIYLTGNTARIRHITQALYKPTFLFFIFSFDNTLLRVSSGTSDSTLIKK